MAPGCEKKHEKNKFNCIFAPRRGYRTGCDKPDNISRLSAAVTRHANIVCMHRVRSVKDQPITYHYRADARVQIRQVIVLGTPFIYNRAGGSWGPVSRCGGIQYRTYRGYRTGVHVCSTHAPVGPEYLIQLRTHPGSSHRGAQKPPRTKHLFVLSHPCRGYRTHRGYRTGVRKKNPRNI